MVGDGHHTRTWFAHLPGVANGLGHADLSAIATASFVYLDAYPLIEAAAVRVVRAVRAAGAPLLINLGGEPLTEMLRFEVAGYENLVIQTNVDDSAHLDAPDLARDLAGDTGAEWAVVTAGAVGSLAASRSRGLVAVPAFPMQVRHTHCAGAVFSGGLLYGLRAGLPIEKSMQIGSANGALRCTQPNQGQSRTPHCQRC